MPLLIILILIVLFLAVYPLIRDALKRRRPPELDFSNALELIIEGKKELAIERLKEIVRRNSEFIDAYLYLSRLYLEKGDFNTAMAIGERLALRRNLPQEKEKKILRHLARLYIQEKRHLKAISILEELIKMDGDAESLATLFALYLREENFSAAEELLGKLAKVAKDKLPLFYAELGNGLLKKDTKKGIAYLEKGEKSELPIPSLLYLAEHYSQTGEKGKAIQTFSTIIEKDSRYFPLLKEKMEGLYYSVGRYNELETIYERYLKSHPETLEFFLALSEIYLKKETPEAAIKVLERYKGDEDLYLLNLLKAYLMANRWESAHRILIRLMEKKEKREFFCPACGKSLATYSLFCPNCFSWKFIIA